MKLPIHKLFNFGTPAVYFDSTGKSICCHIFIDTGWREEITHYESHVAETITLISVFLEEIAVPRAGDQIQANECLYQVLKIHAQDEAIALLHVVVL